MDSVLPHIVGACKIGGASINIPVLIGHDSVSDGCRQNRQLRGVTASAGKTAEATK
jgi:hypothetical protein